jgi:murein DD-endopeptidase MepM/ murein hydrolase activator NlpD
MFHRYGRKGTNLSAGTERLKRALRPLFATLMAALIASGCAQGAEPVRMRLRVPEEVPVGQPFFLEMYVNEPIEHAEVKWRGQSIRVLQKNSVVRIVLGVPNDQKLAGKVFDLSVSFDCSTPQRILAERKIRIKKYNYPKQVLKVPPKMVTPPKSQQKRIAAERKTVSAALSERTAGLPLPQNFLRPVPGIPTAYYGGFRVYNGVPRAGHSGLDLRAAAGSQVRAIADGTVSLTGTHYFAGGSVYLYHGSGVFSSYFHLSKILVKQGQKVKAGDVVALSGATGRVTGPHLHLGLYSNGVWLDPLPLLERDRLPKNVETYYEF